MLAEDMPHLLVDLGMVLHQDKEAMVHPQEHPRLGKEVMAHPQAVVTVHLPLRAVTVVMVDMGRVLHVAHQLVLTLNFGVGSLLSTLITQEASRLLNCKRL